MPQCVLWRSCGNEAYDQHHIWPTALNGPIDGPKVWLCANCHRAVHLCAARIYRGKPIDHQYTDWYNFAKPLVLRVVRALVLSENTSLDDAPARLVVMVNKRILRELHLRKMDLGFSSMERYLLHLISQDLPVQLRDELINYC